MRDSSWRGGEIDVKPARGMRPVDNRNFVGAPKKVFEI